MATRRHRRTPPSPSRSRFPPRTATIREGAMKLATALGLLLAAALTAPAQNVNALDLHDLDGKPVKVATAGKLTAVVFISAKCPVSNDYNDRMSALYKDYAARGVQM